MNFQGEWFKKGDVLVSTVGKIYRVVDRSNDCYRGNIVQLSRVSDTENVDYPKWMSARSIYELSR